MPDVIRIWLDVDFGDASVHVREFDDGIFELSLDGARLVADQAAMERVVGPLAALARVKAWAEVAPPPELAPAPPAPDPALVQRALRRAVQTHGRDAQALWAAIQVELGDVDLLTVARAAIETYTGQRVELP